MTKKQLEKARAALEKCGGKCKECKRLEYISAYFRPAPNGSAGAICYYWRCRLLNGDAGANTIDGVFADAVEYVNSELETAAVWEKLKSEGLTYD